MRQWTLRLTSAAGRRISRLGGILRQFHYRLGSPQRNCESQPVADMSGAVALADREVFRPGEIVEVLSYEEIAATLDGNGICDGLQFMEGMKRLCGHQVTVRKKVRMIFDERTRRMVRIAQIATS